MLDALFAEQAADGEHVLGGFGVALEVALPPAETELRERCGKERLRRRLAPGLGAKVHVVAGELPRLDVPSRRHILVAGPAGENCVQRTWNCGEPKGRPA